jgi:hypothetical protein
LAILGLGTVVFDKAAPSYPAAVYAVGLMIALLCIVVPMVAKSINNDK